MFSKRGWGIVFGLCMAICLSQITTAVAQPKDWGDVSSEELASKVFSDDSSASAVVLFDKAKVELTRELEYELERHVRIKILSEEGYEWGTVELPYNREIGQSIYDISAHTFTMDESGDIERHKVRRRDIFKEEVTDRFNRYKFTFPALRPGAVIEYKYSKAIGHPRLLPDWEFQKTIPVKWSEYRARIPNWFIYDIMLYGYHDLHINDHDRYSESKRVRIRTNDLRTFRTVTVNFYGLDNRWVMKDLPAVKKIPYMTSVNDYKSKLWAQLKEIRWPNESVEKFLKDWTDVRDELMELEGFGEYLNSDEEVRRAVESLTAGLTDPLERLNAIFGYMVGSYVWDGIHYFVADEDRQTVMENKKGNSAELNLLLTQLLREAGFEADPVLLSTRDHGRIQRKFAIANQLNHVIVRVKARDEVYLLDVTSGVKSLNYLPVKDLNEKGLVIRHDNPEWVDLDPPNPTKESYVVNARMDSTGMFKGTLSIKATGYYGARHGRALEGQGENSFVQEILFKDLISAEVDSSWWAGESEEPTEVSYKVAFHSLKPAQSQQAGGYHYINPMLFLQEKENPFKKPGRIFPVDYPHLFTKEYIANITIPEGYVLEERPKSVSLSLPGNPIKLFRLVDVEGNRITIHSKFMLNRKRINVREYPHLSRFYAEVVAAHNENIVLRKADADEMASEGEK